MTKVYCDVCGKEIDKEDVEKKYSLVFNNRNGDIYNMEDICVYCAVKIHEYIKSIKHDEVSIIDFTKTCNNCVHGIALNDEECRMCNDDCSKWKQRRK